MEFSSSSVDGFVGAPGFGWRFPGALTTVELPDDHRIHNIGHLDDKSSLNNFPLSTSWNFNVPFLGRMRILKDRAGLIAASFILLYWLYGNYSTWSAILIPRYLGGQVPFALLMGVHI